MDRHDETSASFIGHLHGLFRSAVRMNPGIVCADRHDRQIDGTGSAQLRKRIAQRGVADGARPMMLRAPLANTAGAKNMIPLPPENTPSLRSILRNHL